MCSDAEPIFADLDGVGTWEAVIDAEPGLQLVLSGDEFDDALRAIADFIDLKSPYTLGHARAVSELVAEAGTRLDLSAPEVRTLTARRARSRLRPTRRLERDLGQAGPLGAGEWERVRIHPYLTERMLHQSEALAPLAAIAVAHRERLDGSGYPRGLSGSSISGPARLLAAADAYQAMREPRPYRPPPRPRRSRRRAAKRREAGRLDADAVEAVLGAAGHRVPRRRGGPAGLTPREVEVLRLLARGLSNKEIAARLVISPKTVANHVEHIYAKIDASTRAGASLFAVQHGLLPEDAVEVAA